MTILETVHELSSAPEKLLLEVLKLIRSRDDTTL